MIGHDWSCIARRKRGWIVIRKRAEGTATEVRIRAYLDLILVVEINLENNNLHADLFYIDKMHVAM